MKEKWATKGKDSDEVGYFMFKGVNIIIMAE